MELLEKRVKSRFNHRFLYVLSSSGFDEFVERTASLGTADNRQATDYVKVGAKRPKPEKGNALRSVRLEETQSVLSRKECRKAVQSLHETSNNNQALHLALVNLICIRKTNVCLTSLRLHFEGI